MLVPLQMLLLGQSPRQKRPCAELEHASRVLHDLLPLLLLLLLRRLLLLLLLLLTMAL